MKSTAIYTTAVTSLLSSLLLSPISAPLQLVALVLFLLGEMKARHEVKYEHPLLERKYQAWEKVLDHTYQYKTGAAQGYLQKRIDWHYHRRGRTADMRGSSRERYVQLFTMGHQQPSQQTIDVSASSQPAQALTQSQQQLARVTQQQQHGEAAEQQAKQPVAAAQADQPGSESVRLLNLDSLRNTALLVIWGTSGGGKTTLARMIAQHREQSGHTVSVADPHGSAAEWGGWRLTGQGRNYNALNELMQDFDEQVSIDYTRYSEGERDFPWSTLIVDEFTGWADRCSFSPLFVKSCCSDIRKIHRCVILVTHSDTLAGLGKASGMRDAIDRSAVKLQLETEIDLETGEYRSLGTGLLQYPGNQPVRVRIPRWEA